MNRCLHHRASIHLTNPLSLVLISRRTKPQVYRVDALIGIQGSPWGFLITFYIAMWRFKDISQEVFERSKPIKTDK